MSCTLLLLVVVAFSPTLFLRSFSDLAALPVHLHIHGAVLTSWFIWFVVQTGMVRHGSIATHRKLGIVGVVIGIACVFAGPLATLGSVRKLRSYGLDWDTDMSVYPVLGIEGIPMETFAKQLVFGNFGSIAAFLGLLVAAVLLRKHAASHKRLMTLAAISIIGPALARIARWPFLGGEDGAFIPIVFLALLLSLVVHDLITTRRVYRATWIGILAIAGVLFVAIYLSMTPFGSAVVRAMA
jgi:hypothetical protein